jgi:hypothetical protein
MAMWLLLARISPIYRLSYAEVGEAGDFLKTVL